jgi:predicted RNase H-like nuclease
MKQSVNITDSIMEVDSLLEKQADSDRLLEAHPEVCFRALNGKPLPYSKSTALGVVERLRILEETAEYETGDWKSIVESIDESPTEVSVDDVLDATVLAITANADDDEFHTLPQSPARDAEGRPMQMVYRSPEVLDFE